MRFSLFLWVRALQTAPGVTAAGLGRCLAAKFVLSGLALALFLVPGCKQLKPTDTRPLDQAGMWFNSIEQLKALKITDADVAELVKARQAGLSDAACIELLRLARNRNQPFDTGEVVAGLRRVNLSEDTILELARLNQLGLWAGEAQAMRLAGLSDQVVLAVARRRASGQPALSGPSLVQLKNAGMNEAELLRLLDRGTTDQEAAQMLAAHQRAMTPSGFIRQRGRRR